MKIRMNHPEGGTLLLNIKGTLKVLALPGWKSPPKVIVHRSPDNGKFWRITEYSSGMLMLRGFKTQKAAIDACLNQISIMGEIRFNSIVQPAVEQYGQAN